MKILVTGVGSPVGAYLAEFLARDGHEVTSIYRNKVSTNKCVAKGITLVKRDLTEGILDIDRADIVVHVAARTAWDYNIPASEYILSNVIGTQKIADYANFHKPRLVIYFSSIAVHGSVNTKQLHEDTSLNHPNMYGLTKYMGERILKEYEGNWPSIIIRLPGVIGPHYFSPFVGRIFKLAVRNEVIQIYNADSKFNAVIDFSHVKEFIDLLIQRDVTASEVVNLAGSSPMKLSDLVNEILSLVSSRSEIYVMQSDQTPFSINIDRLANRFGMVPLSVQEMVKRYVGQNLDN